jgi:hypothetical protein
LRATRKDVTSYSVAPMRASVNLLTLAHTFSLSLLLVFTHCTNPLVAVVLLRYGSVHWLA